MNSVTKLIILMVVIYFNTQGKALTLVITGALMLPLYLYQPGLFTSALKMLKKLKWLFISIVSFYLLFALIKSASEAFILASLREAVYRIIVLILIICAVNLLLQTTPKEQILSALLWLLSPFKLIGFDSDRLALRAVLTIEYFEMVSERLTKIKRLNQTQSDIPHDVTRNHKQTLFHRLKQFFVNLAQQSAIILREILHEAEQTPSRIYRIECVQPPGFMQLLTATLIVLLLYLTL
jgi:hypothetical protein